jgi:hypothetical protein
MDAPQAGNLEAMLNAARPVQSVKFCELQDGQYVLTNIRSIMCRNRNGGLFRSVRIEMLNLDGRRLSTFLPAYIEKVLGDAEIGRIQASSAVFTKTGGLLNWTLSELQDYEDDAEVLQIIGNV